MVMKSEICPCFAPFSCNCGISGLQMATAAETEHHEPERKRFSRLVYYFTTKEGGTKPAVSDISLPAMFLAEVAYGIISASSRKMSQM